MLLHNNIISEEVTLKTDIVHQVGIEPAYVLAVIEARDAGHGVELTHRQVAELCGISQIKARRCIALLRDAGLLKSEEVIEGAWQKANRYHVPTFAESDHTEQAPGPNEQTAAHIEQALLVDIDTEEIDLDTEQVDQEKTYIEVENLLDIGLWGAAAPAQPTELIDSEVVMPVDDLANLDQHVDHPGNHPDGHGDHLADPLEDHLADHLDDHVAALGESGGARCARTRTRRNIFTRSVETDRIVSYFKQRIEEVGREVKGDRRIRGWNLSAGILLQDGHHVEDILKVIDYCAQTNQLGLKKITNLKQIRDDFEYLQESAQSGQSNSPRFREIIGPPDLLELRKRLEEHD